MQSADREVSSKPGQLVQLHFSNQACTFFAAGSQLDWPPLVCSLLQTWLLTLPYSCSLSIAPLQLRVRKEILSPTLCYSAPATPLLIPSVFNPDPSTFLSLQSQPFTLAECSCHFLEKMLLKMLDKHPKGGHRYPYNCPRPTDDLGSSRRLSSSRTLC